MRMMDRNVMDRNALRLMSLVLFLSTVATFCGVLLGDESGQKVPSEGPIPFRVMTYNIHHGRGVDGKVDLERIASLIRDARPDVVALQEVDQGVERTQGRDLPAELGRLTGMKPVFGPNLKFQGGDYGNLILTSHPIKSVFNTHYKMLREGEQRGLLRVELEVEGRRIWVWNTHLDYRPEPAERLSNVREIEGYLNEIGGVPVLLCGDFNEEPGQPAVKRLSERFSDSWSQLGLEDLGFTYSSTEPRKRIDFIFCSKSSGLKPRQGEVLPSEASDHLPVLLEFEW